MEQRLEEGGVPPCARRRRRGMAKGRVAQGDDAGMDPPRAVACRTRLHRRQRRSAEHRTLRSRLRARHRGAVRQRRRAGEGR